MEQAQQSATLINCEADKASQTNSRHLVTSKIISTIGRSMLRLKKLLRFSGIACPRPIPIDRPEPDDVQDFPSILPAMHEKITSYADLQKLIHHALRMQHPDWIGVNGESEMCEFYETRFAKLLAGKTTRGCVVDAVLYLQSASFVTGENLRVDGGVHAGRE
jgi:hypothetical protein